jgi:C-terminal processing protease CtpA/Prc
MQQLDGPVCRLELASDTSPLPTSRDTERSTSPPPLPPRPVGKSPSHRPTRANSNGSGSNASSADLFTCNSFSSHTTSSGTGSHILHPPILRNSAEEFYASLKKSGSGFGLSFRPLGRKIVVSGVAAGSPADESGVIRPGLCLVEINGLKAESIPLPTLCKLMASAERLEMQFEKATSEDFGPRHVRLRRGSSGFGFACVQGAGVLQICNVVPNTPADEAYINVGDTIEEIDGKAVDSIKPSKVLKFLMSLESVTLLVRPAASSKDFL